MKDIKYAVVDHHSMWGWPKQNTSPEQADIIFVWNDFTIEEEVQNWQKKGKKVICFEHGWNAIFDYENNKHKTLADGYMVLGQAGKESLERAGVESNHIIVSGNPKFEIKETITPENTIPKILFTALHWMRDMTEFNNNILAKIIETFEPYADIEVKTNNKSKIDIPDHIPNWRSEINDNFNLFDEIKNKMNDYDVILTPKESTFDFLAILMGKKVFRISDKDDYSIEGDPIIRNILPLSTISPDRIYSPMPLLVDLSKEIQPDTLSLKDIIKWTKTL